MTKNRRYHKLILPILVSLLTGCGKTELLKSSDIIETLDPAPYVTLCEYKGLTVEADIDPEITQEEIEEVIREELKETKIYKEKKKDTAAAGDMVIFEYSALLGTDIDMTGADSDAAETVIGSEVFPKQVEDALIGRKEGEIFTVSYPYDRPEDMEELEDWESENITYVITLSRIVEGRITEYKDLTDDLVKENLGHETRDAYYEAVARQLSEEYRDVLMDPLTDMDSYLLENCVLEDIDALIEEQLNESYRLLKERARKEKIDLKEYIKEIYAASGKEGYKAAVREDAEKNIKLRLIYKAILDEEGIKITEEDAKAYLQSDLELMGISAGSAYKYLDMASEMKLGLLKKLCSPVLGE